MKAGSKTTAGPQTESRIVCVRAGRGTFSQDVSTTIPQWNSYIFYTLDDTGWDANPPFKKNY